MIGSNAPEFDTWVKKTVTLVRLIRNREKLNRVMTKLGKALVKTQHSFERFLEAAKVATERDADPRSPWHCQ